MTFHRIEEEYSLICWASENDVWRINAMRTITGSLRVNVWHFAEDPHGYLRVYCCGPAAAAGAVSGMLNNILSGFPENSTSAEIRELLPQHTIEDGRALRPITTDAILFHALAKLMGIEAGVAAVMFELLREAS